MNSFQAPTPPDFAAPAVEIELKFDEAALRSEFDRCLRALREVMCERLAIPSRFLQAAAPAMTDEEFQALNFHIIAPPVPFPLSTELAGDIQADEPHIV
jgi:hypothetical protein